MLIMRISNLSIIIFGLLLKQSLSLECFTCSSQINLQGHINDRCENVKYSFYEKPNVSHCPDPNVCAKYIVEHNGIKWVHRACQPRDICSLVAVKYNDVTNALIDCQTCSDRDACNLVGKIMPLTILFLLPLFLINA